jgi:MATE family multidrug resistance protein
LTGFLNAARRRRILTLSVPIMLGMMSQTLLNLVDTAFVGSQGDAALAAVGLGSFANFLCVALLQGLGAGVQATASRRLGEGRREAMAVGLNAALAVGTVAGTAALVVGWFGAERLMGLLNDDPAVVEIGGGYLAARFLAIPFVSANFAFRGYWNGTNRSTYYLATLVVMHAINIFLDYSLIYGEFGFPELGAVGAGYATTISIVAGTLVYIGMAWSRARPEGFGQLEGLGEAARRVVRLSLPAGLQQMMYAAGFVMFFSIAGSIGTRELAASTVLVNLLLVCVLPGLG